MRDYAVKLIPIDQLSATIKEKQTPVLLYWRDEWLEGQFRVGKWYESKDDPSFSQWEDTADGRSVDDPTHFALLPDEPEVTAEERAAFEAREKLRIEQMRQAEIRAKAIQDAYNADPNNFPASLDEKDKWEWTKVEGLRPGMKLEPHNLDKI